MKPLRYLPFLVLCLGLLLPLSGAAQQFGFVFESQWSLPAPVNPVRALVFAPDGSWFVAASGHRATFFSLDANGPREQGSLTVEKKIFGMAVSPDGKTVAVVDGGGALSLFARSSLSLVTTVPRAHAGEALAVTFTNDGSYVVTGGEDGKVRVWTLQGQLFADLSRGARHQEPILLLAAVSQERRILSVGRDRQVILWQVDTQQALRPTRVESDILSAAVGGDGQTLVLGLQLLTGNRFRSATPGSLAHSIKTDDRVRLIDAENGTQLREFEGQRQDLDAVSVSPDSRFVAAAGGGADATIWDASTGSRINSVPFDNPVTSLAFAPDGKWLLAGTKSGSLSLYRLTGVGPAIRPSAGQPILILILEPSNLTDEQEAGRGQVSRVDTPSLRLQGRVKSPAELKSLFVDGREITSLSPDGSGGYLFNAFVPMKDPGHRRIEIVAEDVKGTVERRAFVVERAPQVAPPRVGGRRRIALIVGISRYADSSIDLQYAHADAKALYNLLTNSSLGPAAFRKEDVHLLLDGQATVANINKGLREFLRTARQDDFVVFFFAGHGAPDPQRPSDLYLLAHDTDPQNIAGTGILMRHVREAISEIPASQVLILTDSCHAAGIAAPPSMRSLQANPIHQEFLERMRHSSAGLAILTASEAAQVSYENSQWGRHGVFTHYLLQGLEGKADLDKDQIVSLGELMEFVREHVRNATQSRQIPSIGPTSFDRQLPLVIVAPQGDSKSSHPPGR